MTLPSEIEAWLDEKGVTQATINMLPALSLATVDYIDGYALQVAIDEQGTKAIMLPCHDREEVSDWAAWSPREKKLALLKGTGFAIGDLDDIWNPATYMDGGALRLYRDPLEWLLAGRNGGLVVMQAKLARVYLASATRISVPDERAQRAVKRWLTPRPARIVVRAALHSEGEPGTV